MSKFFRKAQGDVNNFFKKSGQADKFFNKDVKKAVTTGANALDKTASFLGKATQVGDKIISQVEKSPYGAALAPLTTAARGALSVGRFAKTAAGMGGNVLHDVTSGRSADKIVIDSLQKAKEVQRASKQINVV